MCLAEYTGETGQEMRSMTFRQILGRKARWVEEAGSGLLFISEFWQTVHVVKIIHGTCQFIML
jgi:hypothetical protein